MCFHFNLIPQRQPQWMRWIWNRQSSWCPRGCVGSFAKVQAQYLFRGTIPKQFSDPGFGGTIQFLQSGLASHQPRIAWESSVRRDFEVLWNHQLHRQIGPWQPKSVQCCPSNLQGIDDPRIHGRDCLEARQENCQY